MTALAERTVGIFGAGKSGVAIARRALDAGYGVAVATSGPAWRTDLVTRVLTPGVRAVDAAELASVAPIVVLAVPLRRLRELPLSTLAGRIVVDIMNYWEPTDGVLPDFASRAHASSLIVRAALPASARLVKTFNHIGYHEMEQLARPSGTVGRVALGVAGDDLDAVATIARFVDDLGFDPVSTGTLADSHCLQPGSPLFGADMEPAAFREALSQLASREVPA
ncbi:NADPH-dependent F420 reductase [Demequina sp. NBRC 110055]|uniref:NADPH-dependent F420 reductase n=1 Tax=Demequina sp. NBRC 110055 TaxID=1570344 RepID=UPI0009FBFFF0|nr:NAD(P)-binding domain-containing protein [Demequina sp. NBRC 110055]